MNIFQKITLKNLKENRTRTLVTIIGIILSAAMFTAVTVSISSLRHYLISHSIYENGSWYGAAYDLTDKEANSISTDNMISDSIRMNRIGYAQLSDSQNENKPYLCVYGIDKNFTKLMPIHLTEGHMPKNAGEILLPEHLAENGGIQYHLNDTLSVELGTRVTSDGEILNNSIGYYPENNIQEQLINTQTHTYTVAGFYERPSFEDYGAPGYTALTFSDMSADGPYDIYFCTKNGSDISHYMDIQFGSDKDETSWTMNYDLLRLYGYSGESSYNSVMFSLSVILVSIIAFGSISLIYNAFSISVSERTKQFGLLSSVGATRHQLVGSVLFESFFLSIIGIPLGILSGIIGIGITFYFTRDMITNYLFSGNNVTLTLHVSFPALFIAVFISLITILISAWLPARHAIKSSAIEAIRQTKDIAIRPGKIKTSKLTFRLFGFEGMLASKNYKRNKRKYRATVISLFLSIVLFISTSSFCAYLSKSVNSVLTDQEYDISYGLPADADISPAVLAEKLSDAAGVVSSSYSMTFWFPGTAASSALSPEYRNYNTPSKAADTFTRFSLYFVKDDVFRNYLERNHLSETDYFNSGSPKAVMVDNLKTYQDGKYYTFSMLSSFENCSATLHLPEEKEGYSYYGYTFDETGNVLYSYGLKNSAENDALKTIDMSPEECCFLLPVNIGASLSVPPDNTECSTEMGYINLYYPYSMADSFFAGLKKDTSYINLPDERPISDNCYTRLTFQSEDHTKTAADMRTILSKLSLPTEPLTDYAVMVDQERALMTVVNIFSYGFITLISLIAAANVFNTISTNIILRKREFAMLKSIGLAPCGFQKMMNFECLLYGFKGLLYGLPVSIFITWQIHRAVSGGLEMKFFIPWYSILIAVGSVFLVVFSTMLYSMHKIKKENIMDTLKDENI